MRKIRLDPETLRVETFAPREDETEAIGTVHANSYVTIPDVSACSEPASQYCVETDFHWNTCGNSCVNMCFPTGEDPSCAC
jgi:hypothetical protein